MIIANGFLRYKIKHTASLDPQTGYPVAPTYRWSDALPCQIIPISQNLQAKSTNNESVSTASYTLLTDIHTPLSEQIMLIDRNGNDIREYPIIATTDLDAVRQTQITI